jgi:hypothetical protein
LLLMQNSRSIPSGRHCEYSHNMNMYSEPD